MADLSASVSVPNTMTANDCTALERQLSTLLAMNVDALIAQVRIEFQRLEECAEDDPRLHQHDHISGSSALGLVSSSPVLSPPAETTGDGFPAVHLEGVSSPNIVSAMGKEPETSDSDGSYEPTDALPELPVESIPRIEVNSTPPGSPHLETPGIEVSPWVTYA
ncbi:predicted protein [Pyrenophora tritici-repentis Pt-1C-BFP]|uniref:Uncharacterized protein n=1 Tax=Pyrenophora tritici-repentis (strain Pt-1C-BFP) TaxID=426418 RepID=B2W8A9_PYRTR|nr:uncharacterized protein PTRG_06217 [Pyrenophora tritici-repentis Pt-1C-BFP]EDU49137.1 predicted protein [Pyrenophora tritici-repentis Pt-1C-BFP]